MKAHVLDLGTAANPVPLVVDVAQRLSGLRARDHPRIAVLARQALQHRDRRVAQMDDLGPGLAVRQAQFAPVQIDVFPSQCQDLCLPASRQHQQADRSNGRRPFRSLPLDLPQHLAQAAVFLVREKPLAPLFPEMLDVPARVGGVRAHLPEFRHCEHARQRRQHPVGVRRCRTHVVVQGHHIDALDVRYPARAQPGQDVALDHLAVLPLRIGLAVVGHVFVEKAPPQFGDGRRLGVPQVAPRQVLAGPGGGDDLGGPGPGGGR